MRTSGVSSGAQNAPFQMPLMAMVLAVYIPIALFRQSTYGLPATSPGAVLELDRPFRNPPTVSGLAHYAEAPSPDRVADTNDDPDRSPYIVYENDRLFGPAHLRYDVIAELGHGRFSHWKGIRANPTSNGTKYWVVLPR